MTKPTFHVASDEDLKLPLMTVVADAEKSGATELTITIAPGTYKGGVHLRAPSGAEKLSFVVEPSAPGVVVLRGGISITGKNVKLRGLVVDGARPAATAVKLHAFESLEVAGLALVGVQTGSDRGEADPLVDVLARARNARATLRDVWVVDSDAGGGALIRVPLNGPGRWASVELDNIALVGNRASYGLDVAATAALTIRNAFVAERALEHAWLLISTHGKLAVEQSVLAVKAQLVDYTSGDGAYPKIKLTATEVLGAKPGKMFDVRDVKTGKMPASIDVQAAAAAAREGQPPDRAALRAGLK
jgi:hypothetical protein